MKKFKSGDEVTILPITLDTVHEFEGGIMWSEVRGFIHWPHTATIVETSNDKIFPIGMYMQNLNKQNFKLFGGTITLRNNS